MAEKAAVRLILALALIPCFAAHWACAPRLDEQQVRTRLVDQLRLQNDRLSVKSITDGALPVAGIDYGGAVANIRFRRQDGVWVIDAVGRDGGWEPADRAVPNLARQLTEKAEALRVAEMMPRYARTLRLLTGWSTLLSADCESGLPGSQQALLYLHGAWHRTLFVNRGTEYHSADLFQRDAWLKPLRVTYSATRIDVRSSGEDRKLDTPDDMSLAYTRSPVRPGVSLCLPQYTIPASTAEALGRPDAPAAWNCSDLMEALKRSGRLELVADRR